MTFLNNAVERGRPLQAYLYESHFFVLCRQAPWTIRKSRIRALSFQAVLTGNLHAGALPFGPTRIYPRTENKIKNRKNFFSPSVPLYVTPVQINFLSKESLPAKAARGSFFLISFETS